MFSGTANGGQSGVAVYLTEKVEKALLVINPIDDRIITLRLKGQPNNITFVQVYAPTTLATDEIIDACYAKLQEALDKIPKTVVVVMMCDFNAKVGQSDTPESSAIGHHGIGERNERGDRLVDFATANEMMITNTLFKQHGRRLYTRTSPDGNTIHQIDYFCIHERWKTYVVNPKTLPAADCGSDHELFMMSMMVKIKKTKAAKHPIRYDMMHIPEQFNVDIKHRLAELIHIVDEMTPK